MRLRRAGLYGFQRLQSRILALAPTEKPRQEATRRLLSAALSGSGRDIDVVVRDNQRCADRRIADQVAAGAWPNETGKWMKIEPGDPLAEMQTSEKGAVVALFHIGPHVLIPTLLARAATEVYVIVLEEAATFWRRNWLQDSARDHIYLVEAGGPSSIRRGVRALRSGAVVAVYCDIVTGSMRSKHRASFLGIDAWLPLGAATLAALADVPILPAVPEATADGKYRLRTFDPIQPTRTRGRSDIVEASRNLLAVFERYLAKHPEEWLTWQSPEEFFIDRGGDDKAPDKQGTVGRS
jgi:lauroyl/myristoyl acyltransferase